VPYTGSGFVIQEVLFSGDGSEAGNASLLLRDQIMYGQEEEEDTRHVTKKLIKKCNVGNKNASEEIRISNYAELKCCYIDTKCGQ
jgi:hypothetical protein